MQGGTSYQALALGLLAGALFSASAIGYRAATVAVEHPQPLFRALVALVAATGFQTLVMTLWFFLAEPGQLRIVAIRWRTVLPVGVTGVLGSLGWFNALQNAAYVRSLGQVELLFSILALVIIFRERLRIIDVLGMLLLAVSVGMIVSTL